MRNTWWIQVSFPHDWPDEPQLAGCTFKFWYPTFAAAEHARAGFRARGAVV